jgi:regulation of enolase protein 1 (concanavalin A-like superfamily)
LLGAILSDGCPRFEYSVAEFIATATSVIANGGMRVTGRISRHHGELSIQYIPHQMPKPLVKLNPCPAAVVSVGMSGISA